MEYEPRKSSRGKKMDYRYNTLSTSIFYPNLECFGRYRLVASREFSRPREEEICWLVWPKAAWGGQKKNHINLNEPSDSMDWFKGNLQETMVFTIKYSGFL